MADKREDEETGFETVAELRRTEQESKARAPGQSAPMKIDPTERMPRLVLAALCLVLVLSLILIYFLTR